MANEPGYRLGEDYLNGFDIKDDGQREYLGYTIVNGLVADEDLKKLTRYSLLRGLEEWDQMLCYARAMMKKASFDDPLDGQDLLTFISRIYQSSGAADEDSEDRMVGTWEKSESEKENLLPTNSSLKNKPGSRQQKNPEPLTKNSKVDKQSPYWSDPHAQLLDKQAKNARRRESRKAHVQGSMSESDQVLLNDSHQQEIIANTELRKSTRSTLSPSPPPPGSTNTSSNMAAAGDGDTTEKDKSPRSPREDLHTSQALKQTLKRIAKSHYFDAPSLPSPPKLKSPRPPRGTVSCIPFPPLDAPSFGLIQEELADDPFRLLVAVTFLIRTAGKTAIPVFRKITDKYPTPEDLARAENTDDIVATIKHLGLGTVRAAAIQKYARLWLEDPPRADVRYGIKNYPGPGDGTDVHAGEVLSPDDPRTSAWEIGHMTTGRYAIDSWRIFCRDVLRGEAENWNGGGREAEFQPEWMRVLPEDKELRACLRWLWMREGWAWDPRTGEREVLSERMRRAVQERRVAYDDTGGLKVLDHPVEVMKTEGNGA
ncbi:hypothetical protein F5X99DRAFT_407317 [Biscogniauxia marginata]|nr:hypothetical protein F5X99DRAFT_407317 [Biscogniauxia marginata]